jgi:hypothetical protein
MTPGDPVTLVIITPTLAVLADPVFVLPIKLNRDGRTARRPQCPQGQKPSLRIP